MNLWTFSILRSETYCSHAQVFTQNFILFSTHSYFLPVMKEESANVFNIKMYTPYEYDHNILKTWRCKFELRSSNFFRIFTKNWLYYPLLKYKIVHHLFSYSQPKHNHSFGYKFSKERKHYGRRISITKRTILGHYVSYMV